MLNRLSIFLLLLLFASSTSCSFDEGKEASDIDLALSKLKEAAKSNDFWVQVHAQEFLLKLGHNKWLNSSFDSLLKKHEKIPQERIGVWRIGVQKSFNQTSAKPYLKNIVNVYLDTANTDRLHAIESLAKLSFPFYDLPNTLLEEDSKRSEKMNGYIIWGKSLATKDVQEVNYHFLLDNLNPKNKMVCETITYALTKINAPIPEDVLTKLYAISNDQRFSDLTRKRLKIVLFINSESVQLSNQDTKNLQSEMTTLLQSQNKSIRYAACEALAVKPTTAHRSLLLNIIMGYNPIDLEGKSKDDLLNLNLDVESAAAFALLSLDKRKSVYFSLVDWFVIIAFLLLMIGIGFYYSKESKNKEDYLLGGRNMNPIMVGLSLFATLVSTLSYLSYPGEMIKNGPIYFFGILSYPLAYYIIGRYIIPKFMNLNVTSAYEVLELKLGKEVRDLGTLFFLSLRFIWMSTILYATVNTALIHIMGFDESYVPWICLTLALITILYTTLGGIKAVVMTDAIQSAVLLGGALLTIFVITKDFGYSTEWFPRTWLPHWKELVWKVDFDQRLTIGNIFVMALLWRICTSGSDQMAIQRYMSTKDIKAAKTTLKVSLWSSALVQIVLAILGLAVFAYFVKHPQYLEFGTTAYKNPDSLFPRFILIGLPVGLSGLVVAGLMAAAMSSLSSGLNSSASVILEDIFDKHFPKALEFENPLKKVRLISIVLGLVITICSMFIGSIEGNLLDIIVKLVNLFVAPLFVLFFMALFVPSATSKGTFFGGIISLVVAILIAFFNLFNLSIFTIMPISLIIGILMSWVLSILDNKIHKES